VVILGPRQDDGSGWVVLMPSSANFTAKSTLGSLQICPIEVLDGAVSDFEGNVDLADGRHVHDLHLIPKPAHYDFAEKERVIVTHAIEFLGLKEKRYRPIDDALLPGWRGLDYRTLLGARIPRLKALKYYIFTVLSG